MKFEFSTAQRIFFGGGRFHDTAGLARELGGRALIVCGSGAGRLDELTAQMAEQGVEAIRFRVRGEPTVAIVQAGVNAAREACSEVIIGFGGGSCIDAAKAIGALLTNPGDLLDYLEVIGKGKALSIPPAPVIAIPTTAGTGSEVTRNAVLGAPEQHVKVSLRSPLMLPRVALVDPELTYSLPPEVTAASGMDALTQLIEAYLTPKANPLTDGFCREGIPRAARALPIAYEHGDDLPARSDMALAALLSGLALANAGLGAVHGFAGPLGGLFDAPHGAVCAMLLPAVQAVNLEALKRRQPDNPVLERYTALARMLTGNPEGTAEEGVRWLEALVERLQIPRLGAYGLQTAEIPEVVEKASRANSMKANPIRLAHDELAEILQMGI